MRTGGVRCSGLPPTKSVLPMMGPQSPAPERRDLRKHPSFAVLPETTGRGVVMVGGKRCFLLPAPDRVCRTHLQCNKSVQQGTSYCLCGLAPLRAVF